MLARRENSRAALAVAAAFLLAPAAAEAGANSPVGRVDSPHFLSSADEARARLAAHGLGLDLFYNANSGVRLAGGPSGRGGERFGQSGSTDLFATLDLAKAGWKGAGTILVHAKGQHGRNINPSLGAIGDPIDDADGSDAYIDQAWYEQSFLSGRVHWRMGYLDQQTVVDRNAFANQEDVQFLATALDNQNPIVPVRVGLGSTVFVDAHDRLALVYTASDAQGRVARAGWDTAFDGPDALFHVFEATLKTRPELLPGNWRLGLVYDPRSRTTFGSTEGSVDHDFGVYISFDQKLWAEPADTRQGAGLFVRWGYRDGAVNRVTQCWSFGAQYDGLLPRRDRDTAGLGFWGSEGSDLAAATVEPGLEGEYGIEAYYRVQIAPWLHVSPDLQYLRNPSGNRSAGDAVVIALRVRLTL